MPSSVRCMAHSGRSFGHENAPCRRLETRSRSMTASRRTSTSTAIGKRCESLFGMSATAVNRLCCETLRFPADAVATSRSQGSSLPGATEAKSSSMTDALAGSRTARASVPGRASTWISASISSRTESWPSPTARSSSRERARRPSNGSRRRRRAPVFWPSVARIPASGSPLTGSRSNASWVQRRASSSSPTLQAARKRLHASLRRCSFGAASTSTGTASPGPPRASRRRASTVRRLDKDGPAFAARAASRPSGSVPLQEARAD